MQLPEVPTQSAVNLSWLTLGAGAFACYIIALGIYRAYYDPLAKFPGSKLAAMTTWYTGYYDIYKRGQYMWKVQEMHEKYGPIIRINPHEIHISDPDFIDGIYSGGSKKRDKFKFTGRSIALPDSTVATMPHDLHRKRRAPLNPFFSKQSIRRLEPIIQDILKNLLERMDEYKKENKVFSASLAFQALTCDVITKYSFGESTNYVKKPDWNAPYFSSVQESFEMAHWFVHLAWFGPLMDSLPVAITTKLMPGMKTLIEFQQTWTKQIEQMRSDGPTKTSTDVVFHGLLFNDGPESEKTTHRLRQEAQLLVLAGQDTTAKTLAAITFELLHNPRVLKKLKAELEEAMPDPEALPTCAQVESLPYLSAVIQEGIRVHPGAVMRMQRVSPDQPIIYEAKDKNGKSQTWEIPAGTPVSMDCTTIHMNPDYFPNPKAFYPERWIENPRLDRYLFAFSKGTRVCLGINLAYQELYLVLAGIFRRYDNFDNVDGTGKPGLALYDTLKNRDVDCVSDLVVPAPTFGSKGIRLLIK